jgi:amino acid adenylation domain-containing protein
MKGLEVEPLAGDELWVRFDLEVHIWEREGEIAISWFYNRDLFDRWRMERMGRHYQRVLEAVVADPEQRIGRVDLFGPEERRQILEEWNETAMEMPEATLAELFEQQADRTPEAVAVVYEERNLTYGELNEQSNRLAHMLIREGIGPEDVVGMAVVRSLEMIVGLLGIVKAGAAYLPLDPDYPAERIAFMLEDAGSDCVLATSEIEGRLPGGPRRWLLDHPELIRLLEQSSAVNPEEFRSLRPQGPLNAAYIIYTSGSTGKPKGVALAHRGLVNLVHWHQQRYQLAPRHRATQVAALSFDASVWEIWPYLTVGASLHLARPGRAMTAVALIAWLQEEQITHSFLPTPLAEAALAEPWPRSLALDALLTGGDRLHAGLTWEGFRLVNHYGPTEATVVTTCAEVPAAAGELSAPPIGWPISNTQVYVLDQQMSAAPIGVRGELYIGGDSLARGYVNSAAMTAERFVPASYGKSGDRMYRTGDLVRWSSEGTLEFLGRADHQVKIRGFRIEPGEIEAVLREHPEVAQAVVVAREDCPGDKRLVGYVVGHQQLTSRQLREYLQPRLPDYMVPGAFVHLEKMPLTSNGKFDLKALPASDTASVIDEYVAPATPTEITLARIWADMLKINPNVISSTANLFELGGHSLLLAKLVAEIRNEFAVELPIRDIMRWPQLNLIAEQIFEASLRNALFVGSDYEVSPDEMEVTI